MSASIFPLAFAVLFAVLLVRGLATGIMPSYGLSPRRRKGPLLFWMHTGRLVELTLMTGYAAFAIWVAGMRRTAVGQKWTLDAALPAFKSGHGAACEASALPRVCAPATIIKITKRLLMCFPTPVRIFL